MDDQPGSGFGRGWIPLERDIGLPGEGAYPAATSAADGGASLAPLPSTGGGDGRHVAPITGGPVLGEAGGARAPSVSLREPPPPEGEDMVVPLRVRADGWSPDRQRAFLENLAACGSVSAAARAVGMSRESAYALRRRAEARGFAQAWDAARLLAAEHLVDLAWDRAVNGMVRPLVYHGEVVGEVRHFDNRLLLGLIAQNRQVLAEQGLSAPPELTAAVAGDWDAALARVERGEFLPDPGRGTSAAGGGVQASVPNTSGQHPCEHPPAPLHHPADGEDIPPPLPPETDTRGEPLVEAQQLEIGTYGHWWDDEHQCYLTNWPTPPDWSGDEFRLDDDDTATRIDPDAEDADGAGDTGALRPGAPPPPEPGWARTLSAAELDGLERAEAHRAARLELYRRQAFGLASPAECHSLSLANPGTDRGAAAADVSGPCTL